MTPTINSAYEAMEHIHDYRQRASVLTALAVFSTLSWTIALTILTETGADRSHVILFMLSMTISSYIIAVFVMKCHKVESLNIFLNGNPELTEKDRLVKESKRYSHYTMTLTSVCMTLSGAAAITTTMLLVS